MPLTIDWPDIALRLALTILAGSLLGLDRTERGMAAGLRSTLLVCLAASVSMIQVNLLLTTTGKSSDSFAVLDMMRLPLGILTGMGFIGAGAIIRHDRQVSGVTTAATLWLATILGLCFGGGQHGLGLAALALGLLILWVLKWLETGLPREQRGLLSLTIGGGGPTEDDIQSVIRATGGKANQWSAAYGNDGTAMRRKVSCRVRSKGRPADSAVPEFVKQLAERTGVRAVRWQPE